MSSESLRNCPTCHRHLDDKTRANMGLRSGEILNSLCPGKNGPSDIDHVLHNAWMSPERMLFLEYKRGNARLTGGQKMVLEALKGDWESEDGRHLSIRYMVLDEDMPLDKAKEVMQSVVEDVWPVLEDVA